MTDALNRLNREIHEQSHVHLLCSSVDAYTWCMFVAGMNVGVLLMNSSELEVK
jgi:hypothetical protein